MEKPVRRDIDPGNLIELNFLISSMFFIDGISRVFWKEKRKKKNGNEFDEIIYIYI